MRGVFVTPLELAAIDDDAADRGAVAAEELRGRVDHDIRAVFDGAAEVRRRHGVVDDQRHAGFMRDLGDSFDIDQVHARIGEGFGVHGARLGA